MILDENKNNIKPNSNNRKNCENYPLNCFSKHWYYRNIDINGKNNINEFNVSTLFDKLLKILVHIKNSTELINELKRLDGNTSK